MALGSLHQVEISACVRRLRHKRHSFEEKRTARFVNDGVAENNGVANVVHLGANRQRLAHREAQVPAALETSGAPGQKSRNEIAGDAISLLIFLLL